MGKLSGRILSKRNNSGAIAWGGGGGKNLGAIVRGDLIWWGKIAWRVTEKSNFPGFFKEILGSIRKIETRIFNEHFLRKKQTYIFTT